MIVIMMVHPFQTPSSCDGAHCSGSDSRHNDQDPTCDSTSGGSGGQNLSDSSDAKSENHSRSDKPVNLSFKK